MQIFKLPLVGFLIQIKAPRHIRISEFQFSAHNTSWGNNRNYKLNHASPSCINERDFKHSHFPPDDYCYGPYLLCFLVQTSLKRWGIPESLCGSMIYMHTICSSQSQESRILIPRECFVASSDSWYDMRVSDALMFDCGLLHLVSASHVGIH